MNRTEVIEKIKKCLALSQSSNEHEAVLALKQAQALMKKYNLDHAELKYADVGELELDYVGGQNNEATDLLFHTIAIIFECGAYTQKRPRYRGRRSSVHYVYFGLSPYQEIAAYAFGVLLPIMQKHRSKFVANLHPNYRRKKKLKLGQVYVRGWVKAIELKCRPLHPDLAIQSKLNEYGEHIGLITHERAEVSGVRAGERNWAINQGYADGENVDLNIALNTSARQKALLK